MSRKTGQFLTDRQRIIEWYKEDLERYKGMIGKETEYGTIVSKKLIRNIEIRILELKIKEKLDDIERELP